MERPAARLTSVMGVARALLLTVGPVEAAQILLAEFGWDQSFQALALLRGDDADRAFAATWEHLLVAAVEEQLRAPAAEPIEGSER